MDSIERKTFLERVPMYEGKKELKKVHNLLKSEATF